MRPRWCHGSSGGSQRCDHPLGPTTALTKAPVVVAKDTNLSGPGGTRNAARAVAAQAWERWVNANGGILGHPVKVLITDDGGNPINAQAAVKVAVEAKGAIATVGGTARTDATWAAYVASRGVPVISGFAMSAPWGQNPWFFATSYLAATVQGSVVAAKTAGAKSFAAGVCAEVAVCLQARPIYEASAESHGLEPHGLVYDGLLKIGAADPSYTAQSLAWQQSGADFVQLSVASSTAQKVVEDCATQGFKPVFGIGTNTVTKDFLGLPTLNAGGPQQGFPWFLDDPATKLFRDAMAKYAAGDWNDPPAPITWSALEVFHKAMAHVSDQPASNDVTAGLYSLKDQDLGGLIPQKLSFTRGQPTPAVDCYFLVGVNNRKFVAPQGLKPQCIG